MINKRSMVLHAAAKLLLAGTSMMVLSSCAIVPGLQIRTDAPDAPGSVRVTERGNEKLVEVVSDRQVLQAFKLVTMSGDVLMKERLGQIELAATAPGLGSVTPDSSVPEYRIGPGDVIQIIIWDHPELTSPTGEFRDPVSSGRLVSADGMLFYPYAGELKVSGMTVPQVRNLLSERLAKVISKPQVDVRVVAYRSQRVQVSGEVAAPGLVTLDDTPKGILEALSERGGFAASASRRSLTLIRQGISHEVNLSGLIFGGHPDINPPLHPGDIIHVPHKESQQVFVFGEVGKQAEVALDQSDISLTQVLARSGGLDQLRADDSGVLVFRKAANANEVPTIYALDIGRPMGLLLAGEFLMQPRDVVYVQATGFAKYNAVIGQFLPTISAIFQLDRLTARQR
ncbi:MAG: polysaccharide biosynthesis/export family protein [Stagnimonas sp.]|nr:polysaccharide biosynthesis/export family protein [Stagnimonas sp.]